MAILQTLKHQFFDSSGNPLSGGKLYAYAAGTSTPKDTYTDQGGLTANANPVILDSRGEASIWFNGSYKVVLKTAADATIWTVDNIQEVSTGYVTLTGIETLTNKTLTSPTISSPTITGSPVISASTLTADSTVRGNATTGTTTSSAVVGVASTSGSGVYGSSSSGYALRGASTTGGGLYVTAGSSGDGVYGSSSSGNGVYGASTTGNGVYGATTSGYGVYGQSLNSYGVVAQSDTTSPAKAALRVVPQDTEPSGANAVGDMYVTTAGVLKICTVAGTPGTWVSVGAQT